MILIEIARYDIIMRLTKIKAKHIFLRALEIEADLFLEEISLDVFKSSIKIDKDKTLYLTDRGIYYTSRMSHPRSVL